MNGAIVTANFDPNGAAGSGFGVSTFTINGGGNSLVAYDSLAVSKALQITGLGVLGVREYH